MNQRELKTGKTRKNERDSERDSERKREKGQERKLEMGLHVENVPYLDR